MTMTAEERSLRARAGAYAQQAAHDTRETTKAARAAFHERFLDLVDPEHQLPEIERQRRAQAAMRSYMARLALRSAQARRRRKAS